MNINNLQVQLQTAVENAATEASTDNTSATLYYLQLAKAIQALNMGQIRTIDQVSNLPSAAASEGWLYFVDNIERLYFSNGTVWADIAPATVYNNAAWAWGCNNAGMIGDNTTVSKSSPVSVVGGFTDWCQIAGGSTHSLGLRTNGTVWAWGNGGNGRLGTNNTTNCSSPVSVVGGFTDWCNISAGVDFSLAIRTNSTIWGWGLQSQGQLGDSTIADRSSPVSVVGGFTDWCQVSAGFNHGTAVRTNGSIWGWGCNAGGRLGNNATANVSSPVSVVGGFTNWCRVAAGGSHTLGLNTSGIIWAWGYGSYGRLGNNCTTNRSSPVSVVGGFTDWCQISAGTQHSAAVRTNGTLWTWGYGFQGQIGDNAGVVTRSSPVSVVGGFTNWCQASAGANDSFGVRTNGTLWAWGNNGTGRLGDGTTTNRSSPVSVVGGFTDWFRVACSPRGYQTLAIRSTQV